MYEPSAGYGVLQPEEPLFIPPMPARPEYAVAAPPEHSYAAARSTLAATEATVQQAKSEAVVRGAQSVGSQLVDGVIARQALARAAERAVHAARRARPHEQRVKRRGGRHGHRAAPHEEDVRVDGSVDEEAVVPDNQP